MVTFNVEGMSCGGCETNVTDAILDVEGVTSANADHESGTATIEGDVDIDAVFEAVRDAGYDASA